jgi:hypothetical protein
MQIFDDQDFCIFERKGSCKSKEYNMLAKLIFDIKVVGNLVVCVKKLIE